MGKRRVIAVFLCLSLVFAFCPGIGKVEQAGAAAQEGIKIWEDTLGKVSETGYIPVNKKTLNEDDLHVGKKRMSTRRSVSIPLSMMPERMALRMRFAIRECLEIVGLMRQCLHRKAIL